MQSQDVLQRALADYPGSVLIVSHNRSFLDPVVSKTLEFRPGEAPRLFAGNISYYLEKSAAENQSTKPATASKAAPAARSTTQPGVSRKDQRRAEAEARDQRNKLLKPLETELAALEIKIAELEAAQATLNAALTSEEIISQTDKLRETSNAISKITHSLETAYSRWGVLTDEIEKVKAKLGITD
jgi:ATP-binding cassette subfamily F protein 3